MEFEFDLIDVTTIDEERVFVEFLNRGRGRGSGLPVEMTVYDIWSFRDGLVSRRQTFYDRAEATAAAGLSTR